MKKLLIVAGLFLLASCSSSNKKTSEPVKAADNIENEPLIEDSSGSNGKAARKDRKSIILEPNQNKKTENSVLVNNGNNSYAQLNIFIKNQDEEGILRESSKILMQNTSDIKALNSMAMVYYKRGQYGLAKNLLFRAQRISPTYEVYSNIGIVLLANDERSEALKNFKKAIELNPNDTVSASNAGAMYVKAYDYEKAGVALEIAYKRGMRDYRILNNYAVALVGLAKYEKAEGVYKEALKENNNSKEVLFNYASLLIEHQKRYQEGLDYLQKLKFVGVPEDSRAKLQELEAIARREQK